MLKRDEIIAVQKILKSAGLLYGNYKDGEWDRTVQLAYESYVKRNASGYPTNTPMSYLSLPEVLRNKMNKPVAATSDSDTTSSTESTSGVVTVDPAKVDEAAGTGVDAGAQDTSNATGSKSGKSGKHK